MVADQDDATLSQCHGNEQIERIGTRRLVDDDVAKTLRSPFSALI